MAATQDLTLHSGDDYVIPIDIKTEAGAAVPLTGATVRWQMSRGTSSKFSSTPFLSKQSPSGGIVITDAPNGLAELTIDGADTASVSGDFYHEVEVEDSGGKKTTVIVGDVKILRDLIA